MDENQDYKYIKNHKEVKVKKYFYLLRPILSAKYVLDFKDVPPIEFDKLRQIITPKNINEIIDNLLKIKKNSEETQLIQKNQELDQYIENTFINVKNEIELLPKEKEKSWDLLNEEFKKVIATGYL